MELQINNQMLLTFDFTDSFQSVLCEPAYTFLSNIPLFAHSSKHMHYIMSMHAPSSTILLKEVAAIHLKSTWNSFVSFYLTHSSVRHCMDDYKTFSVIALGESQYS